MLKVASIIAIAIVLLSGLLDEPASAKRPVGCVSMSEYRAVDAYGGDAMMRSEVHRIFGARGRIVAVDFRARALALQFPSCSGIGAVEVSFQRNKAFTKWVYRP